MLNFLGLDARRLLKRILAIAGLLLLGRMAGYGRFQIAMGVVACRLLGIRSLSSVFWVTLVFLFTARPFLGMVPTHWPETELMARYGESDLADWGVRYFGLLARLGLAYVVFQVLMKLPLRQRFLVLHLVMLVLILTCGAYLRSGPVVAAIGMYFLISFCWYFPVLLYLLADNQRLSPRRFLELYVVPFWETSPNPQPILGLEHQPELEDALLSRCIKLSFFFAAFIGGGNLIHSLLLNVPFYGLKLPLLWNPIPDLEVTGLSTSVFLVYPRWKIALSIFWAGVHRVTGYMALGTLIECCRLLLCYDVPRRFIVPWKVTSFADFYNCIMPYYVVALNRIYIQPIYTALRHRGWGRKWGFEMAVLVAIFAGNLTIHILRDVELVIILGGSEYLWLSLITELPYCLLLYLLLRFMTLPKRAIPWVPWPARITFFCFLYSLIILMRMGGLFVSPLTRWSFAMATFFGTGL